jgi:hypothetical protein
MFAQSNAEQATVRRLGIDKVDNVEIDVPELSNGL